MNTLLGIDLGMGAIKMHGAAGGLQFLSQTAIAGTGEIKTTGFMKRTERPIMVSGDFGRFYAGKDAHDFGEPVENVDFDRLVGSVEMKALLYGAWTEYQRRYGKFSESLDLVIGLPHQMLSDENATASVRKWLKGAHWWNADGNGYQVIVEKVAAAPQAMGPVFDYSFDLNGEPVADAIERECGTVSIGFNTTELFVSKRKSNVERFVGGDNVGARWLLQQLKERRHYTLGELDNEIRAGRLDLDGHVEEWWVAVQGFINEKWKNRSYERFNKVFLVGGGAILLKNQLMNKFALNYSMPKDPVMCIAVGLYKAGMLQRK